LKKRQRQSNKNNKENIALEKKKAKEQGRAVLSKEEKTEGNTAHLHCCKSRGATRKGNKVLSSTEGGLKLQ